MFLNELVIIQNKKGETTAYDLLVSYLFSAGIKKVHLEIGRTLGRKEVTRKTIG